MSLYPATFNDNVIELDGELDSIDDESIKSSVKYILISFSHCNLNIANKPKALCLIRHPGEKHRERSDCSSWNLGKGSSITLNVASCRLEAIRRRLMLLN